MPLNVVIPPEPKDPSMIHTYNRKETYSGELEGILVLCFLGILFGVIFKVDLELFGKLACFECAPLAWPPK
ncbi:hypothetical protein POVWA2_057730 [Plasmodium ovale wallikeri]|uniref:Uncharacterized protein n=1 Tax=Plasmodium ovale wallikeri TaxID=864142 RepID=A0A1A8ZXV3_PLAOA|nr:hypothetical protein POVWA1_058380 [Plasmodium ovale wallikeri]SBT49158.1 hypothetical protein POVWA2_057730 [Plasmodium ovale wallikeri]